MAQRNWGFQAIVAIVAAVITKGESYSAGLCKMWSNSLRKENLSTLNREPIEENFDVLEDSSAKGGNKDDTKEHLEALKSAWCSATT